jgi:hypothetical protein
MTVCKVALANLAMWVVRSNISAKKSTRPCSNSPLYPRNSCTGFAGPFTSLKVAVFIPGFCLAALDCFDERRDKGSYHFFVPFPREAESREGSVRTENTEAHQGYFECSFLHLSLYEAACRNARKAASRWRKACRWSGSETDSPTVWRGRK